MVGWMDESKRLIRDVFYINSSGSPGGGNKAKKKERRVSVVKVGSVDCKEWESPPGEPSEEK